MGFFKKLFGIEELPPPEVISVTDRNFREVVLKSKRPVLLDIWSNGCAPCTQLAPIVTRLSQKYHGRLRVAELNVSNAPKTARKLRVMGTPTVVYFHKGRERHRVVGLRGSLYHEEYIDHELMPAPAQNEALGEPASS